MKIELELIFAALALLIGGVVGYFLHNKLMQSRMADAKAAADKVIETAKKEADALRKEAQIQAKDTVLQAKIEWEDEIREERRELQASEKRLLQKEENLERKLGHLESKEEELARKEQSLNDRLTQYGKKEKEVDGLLLKQRGKIGEPFRNQFGGSQKSSYGRDGKCRAPRLR